MLLVVKIFNSKGSGLFYFSATFFIANEFYGQVTKKLSLALEAPLDDRFINLFGQFVVNSKMDSFHAT